MRDERTGSGSSRNGLENRSLDLEAACLVEIFTHRGDDLRPLDEDFLDLRVHDEVDIAHPVAKFRIREGVMNLSVRLLHDRKNAERLAQEGEFLGVDGELARLGDEGETLDSDYVADVEEFLEDGVVHCFVLARADIVTLNVYLDPAFGVLKFEERRRAHNAPGHHPSRYANVLKITFLRIVSFGDALCGRVDRIEWRRIWFDSQFSEFPKRFSAKLFLLASFYICHDES